MTFIHELEPYPLKMYPQAKNELYRSKLSKVIVLQRERQTDTTKNITTSLHGW